MFSLTKQEKNALICLIIIILVGTTLHFILQKNPQLNNLINTLESDRLYLKVDLNTASYEELVNLSFVGPVMAKRIIDFRTQHGFFDDVAQLKNVTGIKESNYKRISKFLKVEKQ